MTPSPHLTLSPRIQAASARGGVVTFIDGDAAASVSWADLHADARGLAVGLAAHGVGPGAHVAILGPTTRDLVTTIEAVWLAGATVVVLPLPMRMASLEDFVAQTRSRILGADSALVVVDPQLAPFVAPEPGDPPMVGYDELRAAADPGAWREPAVSPDSLAILQFTSGSTSDPKGVMLPHRTLVANIDGMREATGFDPADDVVVTWLPMYHDMGLVGMLTTTMTTGGDLVIAGPQTFTASPSRWMEWLSTYGGTITAGPNFSWVLATRALKRLEGLDLSRVRIALNGAEPVDARTVAGLVEAGERHGLRAGAVFPAFGMAEVCIGGTFPEPLSGLRTDDVDGRVLETERYAAPAEPGASGVKRLARLGRPVPGLEVRIADPADGRPCGEREVGEVQIRGTSVTSGYYGRPDATAAAFDGDWLRTGDLGYLVDGELVVCGRIKDVIIVAGRNVFPEDVERSVAEIEGVRAGNVIAFGVEGRRREGLVVVAEARADDTAAVRDEVAARVRSVVGLAAADVVLVEPGSLPKTSSGKLQRSLCRDRYLVQDLQPV
jgi:fatty-acyl-CoA synthase